MSYSLWWKLVSLFWCTHITWIHWEGGKNKCTKYETTYSHCCIREIILCNITPIFWFKEQDKFDFLNNLLFLFLIETYVFCDTCPWHVSPFNDDNNNNILHQNLWIFCTKSSYQLYYLYIYLYYIYVISYISMHIKIKKI